LSAPDRQDPTVGELAARLDLPLGNGAPGAARHAIRPMLYNWGFRDLDWLDIATVVVSELVSNAVVHGGGCLSLELLAHDGGVTVAVADGSAVLPRRGRGDPEALDPVRLAEGGRGIALVEALGCR
jgi:anti-sigma regulatory factor (Ser/Thr protein kinase)